MEQLDPAMLAQLSAMIGGASDEKLRARAARGLPKSDALAGANQRAGQMDLLNFAAGNSNNEALAASTAAMTAARRKDNTPMALGQQGFALPSGEFVESPIHAQQQADGRAQTLVQAMQAMQEKARMTSDGNELRAQLASDANATKITVAEIMAAARRDAADARGAKEGRPLPQRIVADIGKVEGAKDVMSLLHSSWDDKFKVAPMGIGDAQNWLGSKGWAGEKSKETSNWWKNYNEQKNIIRNQLFGSALTKSEGILFDKANVLEGDDSQVIRTKLAQQEKQSTRAYNKLVANYSKGGHDTSEWLVADVPDAPNPGQVVSKQDRRKANSALDDVMALYPENRK